MNQNTSTSLIRGGSDTLMVVSLAPNQDRNAAAYRYAAVRDIADENAKKIATLLDAQAKNSSS